MSYKDVRKVTTVPEKQRIDTQIAPSIGTKNSVLI